MQPKSTPSLHQFVAVVFAFTLFASVSGSSFGNDFRLGADPDTVFQESADHLFPMQAVSVVDGFASSPGVIANYFDEISSRNQSGLLGRAYADAQYISLVTPDEFDAISETMPGYRGSVNLPAPWTVLLPDFLKQDIFISGRHLGFSGSMNLAGFALSVDAELDEWVVGTTLFTTIDTTFHPFVQVGYNHQTSQMNFSSIFGKMSEVDTEDRLFVAPGFEIDITSELALRFATELDFDEVPASIMTTELIFWFSPHLFARGGLMNEVDFETYGGVIGGGIAF
jgi:hypothetical protein